MLACVSSSTLHAGCCLRVARLDDCFLCLNPEALSAWLRGCYTSSMPYLITFDKTERGCTSRWSTQDERNVSISLRSCLPLPLPYAYLPLEESVAQCASSLTPLMKIPKIEFSWILEQRMQNCAAFRAFWIACSSCKPHCRTLKLGLVAQILLHARISTSTACHSCPHYRYIHS